MSKIPIKSTTNRRFLADFQASEHQHIAELAAVGQLVGLERIAELLGVPPQVIADEETSYRIFSLNADDGNRLYPRFYASRCLNRELLEAVSKELSDLPGASKWQFFTGVRLSLGTRTPLEAIEAGESSLVLAAARAYREA